MTIAKILIFDGDPTAALVTQHGLQRLQPNSEVSTATSAGDAWLSCLHQSIDLLIIDPSPANSAASALIKALRIDRPDTDVLVLTAYDTPGLRAQMHALGVVHYLAKPVDLRELGHEVGQLIEQRAGAH
ncbi:MAG: response regulator [Chloroflexota bacterium]|nr:response regulator [Chloroflexota bacterium]